MTPNLKSLTYAKKSETSTKSDKVNTKKEYKKECDSRANALLCRLFRTVEEEQLLLVPCSYSLHNKQDSSSDKNHS